MPLETTKFYDSCLNIYKDPFQYSNFFETKINETGGEQKVFSIKNTLFHFFGRYEFLTFIDTKEIYIKEYNKGLYYNYGEEIINMELSRFEETHNINISDHRRTKIIKEIKLRSFIERSEVAEHKYPYWLNFRNVWYNIETKKLFRHNYTKRDYAELETNGDIEEANKLYQIQLDFEKDKIFLTQTDIKYEQPSNCINFDKFLERILPDKTSRETIYELFGYCLYNGYPIQQVILFIGDGDNGKSTLLLTLKKFLGQYNITAVDIYSLAEDRFASAELYMKKACINADLESKYLSNIGVLKRLTGGDLIMGQRKRKDPFYFQNTAKLILSMNQLFKVSDTELIYSFFRRLCVIPFPIRIPKPEKKDQKKLVEEMTTDCELSGILLKSLEGLDRLLKNKCFSNKMNEAKLKEEWIRLSDPSKWFFESIISEGSEEEPGENIWQSDLFEIFLKICKKENLPEQSQQYFSRMATKYGIKKKLKIKKDEGRKTMYLNLMFNNGYSELAFQIQGNNTEVSKPKKSLEDIFQKKKLNMLDFLPQIRHYLMMSAGEHEDGDINLKKFKNSMISTYKYTDENLEEILENLSTEGEIYEPRPGIIRLSDENK